MFDWLLCYVLKNSHSKLDQSLKEGKDAFTARNENQVFYSKTLSIVFIEVNYIPLVCTINIEHGRFLIMGLSNQEI